MPPLASLRKEFLKCKSAHLKLASDETGVVYTLNVVWETKEFVKTMENEKVKTCIKNLENEIT